MLGKLPIDIWATFRPQHVNAAEQFVSQNAVQEYQQIHVKKCCFRLKTAFESLRQEHLQNKRQGRSWIWVSCTNLYRGLLTPPTDRARMSIAMPAKILRVQLALIAFVVVRFVLPEWLGLPLHSPTNWKNAKLTQSSSWSWQEFATSHCNNKVKVTTSPVPEAVRLKEHVE